VEEREEQPLKGAADGMQEIADFKVDLPGRLNNLLTMIGSTSAPQKRTFANPKRWS